MYISSILKRQGLLSITVESLKPISRQCFSYTTMQPGESLPIPQEVCRAVSSSVGGLDELESSLNQFTGILSSTFVTQVIDSCKHEAPARRLTRFFLWAHKHLCSRLEDSDFNYVIRVMAEKKDHTAMQILISDLRKDNRTMDAQTFSLVADILVKLGREDEALGIFKNLDKFRCPQDSVTVAAIVGALCTKGHAKKAAGVIFHHRDKISGAELCIYRSLLHGWSLKENIKEARKVIQEMKANGIQPDMFCYTTLLRCLCNRNLKRNPSGLVPEALNIMMEMRSYKIAPTSISYNILLSCLGKTRRVRESCRVLEIMKSSGVAPDCVTYYLVARVSFLTGRYGKGAKMVDEMIEQGLVPDQKFYCDLIGVLCGVERIDLGLELFERMKKSSLCGYKEVYDVLIPKLCKGGDFEKARELWNEASALGLSLGFSSDVLDPTINEVFKPTRKIEEIVECKPGKFQAKIRVFKRKVMPKKRSKKKIKKKSAW